MAQDSSGNNGLRRNKPLDLAAANKAGAGAPSEVGKAFRKGLRQTEASARSGLGALAGAAGFEETALAQQRQAEELQKQAAELTPQVDSLSDVTDLGSAGQFAVNKVVEQLPNIASTVVGGAAGRGAAALAKAGKTATRVATGAGSLGAGAGIETGSIQSDLLSDEEARKTNSVQDLSRTALAGGALAGSLEALPIFRVFDKFGVGKAGRQAITKPLQERLAKEAAKGAVSEGVTEAAQTVIERGARKFANENFEVFGEEGLREIAEAGLTGAVIGTPFGALGGIPGGEGRIGKRIADLEAQDELSSAQANATANRLRGVSPELIAGLEAQGLDNPTTRTQLNDAALSFDRDIELGPTTENPVTTRLAAGKFKGRIENIQEFNSKVSPALKAIATGEVDFKLPEVKQFLSENFDDSDQLLDSVAEALGSEGTFEQTTLIDSVLEGAVNLSDPLPGTDGSVGDRIMAIGGQAALSDAIQLDPNLLGEETTGEGGVEFLSINVEKGPSTEFQLNQQGLPWLSRAGAERLHGKEFSTSSIEKAVDSANTNGTGDFLEVPYSQVVMQEAKDQGIVAKREVQEFLGQRAAALIQAKPETQALLDQANPQAFLDSFSAVEFTRPSPAIATGDLEIPQQRLNPQLSEKGKRKQAKLKGIKRRAKENADEATVIEADKRLKEQNTQLRRISGPIFSKAPAPGKDLFPGQLEVTVDGKRAVVNAKNLTASAIGSQDVFDNKASGRIKKQFNQAISSLLSLKDREVKLVGKIPDDLVIFAPSKARKEGGAPDITFGEARLSGSAAVKRVTGPAARTKLNETLRVAGKEQKDAKKPQELLSRFEKGQQFLRDLRKDSQAVRDSESVFKQIKELEGKMDKLDTTSPEFQAASTKADKLRGQQQKLNKDSEVQRSIKAKKRLAQIRSQPGMNKVVGAFFNLQSQTNRFKALTKSEKEFASQEAIGERKENEQAGIERLESTQSTEPSSIGEADGIISREGERRLDRFGNDTRVQFDAVDLDVGQTAKMQDLRKLQTKSTIRSDQKIANGWIKALGIDRQVELLTVDAAATLMNSNAPKMLDKFLNGGIRGFALRGASGKVRIFIHPRLTGGSRLSTLGHEVGHIIMNSTLANSSRTEQTAIKRSFEKWRDQFGRSTTIGEVLLSRKPIHSLLDTLSKRSMDVSIEKMNKADQAYLLDFNEWFADNAAKWLLTDAKPVGVVQEFFAKIAGFMKAFVKMLKNDVPDVTVARYLDGLFVGTPKRAEAGTKAQAEGPAGVMFDKLPGDIFSKIDDMLKKTTGIKPTKGKAGRKTEFTETQFGGAVWVSAAADEDTYSEATNQAMRAAFQNLLSPEEKGILTRAFSQSVTMRNLRKLLADDPAALKEISRNPNAAAAYGYQFWVAGELKVGPQVKTVFDKIVDIITQTLGIVQESDAATQILSAFADGRVRLRSVQRRGNATLQVRSDFVVQRRINETRIQKFRAAAEVISDSVAPTFGKLLFTADGQMRATKNPWLIKLSEEIHARVGTERVKETMFEARIRTVGRFTNILQDIFKGQDAAFGQEVLGILQGADVGPVKADGANQLNRASKSRNKAVKRVRSMLRQLLSYQKQAGVDLGDRGGKFFPRIVDIDVLQRDNDLFITAIANKKYDEHLATFVNRKANTMTPALREQAAEKVAKAYLVAGGDTDAAGADIVTGEGAPFNASANERALGWIDAKDIEPFLNKDLGLTMTRYIDQAVKRAEYTRRFGEKGEGLKDLLAKAQETGASEQDIDRADKYIQAMMGTLGTTLDPKYQKLQGAIMVYQNLRLLALSTMTSMVDPVGILVRGDIEAGLAAFKAGIAEVKASVKGETTELRSLGNMLGTIDTYMSNEALGWEYGGHFITGRAKQINELFFRAIGLQKWTRNTRLMALAGARAFLMKHADGKGTHSKRWLSQLNLEVGDVKLDKDGELRILSARERRDLGDTGLTKTLGGKEEVFEKEAGELATDKAELARDDKVRAALNRWVNEAILRPDAAQRPIWASDPHWMLVFHLKSFTYAFHDRILKRVSSELKEGNFWPLLYLQGFIPGMIGVEAMRDALQGDENDDDMFGTVSNAAERSGLTGLFQLAKDATRDVKYGGTGVESFAGPTIQQIVELIRLPLQGDERQWKTFKRSLPANSIWRGWNLFDE